MLNAKNMFLKLDVYVHRFWRPKIKRSAFALDGVLTKLHQRNWVIDFHKFNLAFIEYRPGILVFYLRIWEKTSGKLFLSCPAKLFYC